MTSGRRLIGFRQGSGPRPVLPTGRSGQPGNAPAPYPSRGVLAVRLRLLAPGAALLLALTAVAAQADVTE